MLRRIFYSALLILLFAVSAHGQTAVTGTITDPNGNPYANGTASAQLSVPTGQVQPPPTNTTTNSSGLFSMTLPTGSYVFTICSAPVLIGVPTTNPTPVQVCFANTAPILIAGGSADVSSSLNPVASVIGPRSGGGSGSTPAPPAGAIQAAGVGATAPSNVTCNSNILSVDSIVSPTTVINPCVFAQQADSIFTGPAPYVDAQAYGHFSSNNTITVTTSANSNQVATTGIGDFQRKTGIVIPKAGAATSQSTPTAPTITNDSGVTGTATFNYQCIGAGLYEDLTAASPAGTITTAPNIFGAAPIVISSISRASNVVSAVLSSSVTLSATNGHVLIVGVSGGSTSFNGLFLLTNGVGTTSTLTFAQTGANESGTVSGTSTAQLRNAYIITAISRATNGSMTITTDVPTGWATGSFDANVQIWGVTPQDMNGWYQPSSVTGNTITIPTAIFPASTETGSLTALGQPYGFNNVMGINSFEEEAVVCPALSGTTTHYYIYANYGSGYNLVGSTPIGRFVFLDWGPFYNSGYTASPAAAVPLTPPASTQNAMFVGTIASINGSTLTLNQNVSTQVNSATAYHDDSLNVAAAAAPAASNGMAVNFEPFNGPYIFNAPLILNNGFHSGTYFLNFEVSPIFNEPFQPQGISTNIDAVLGSQSAVGGFDNYVPITGLANPLIYTDSGAVHIRHMGLTVGQPEQYGMIFHGFLNEVCDDYIATTRSSGIGVWFDGGFTSDLCNLQFGGGIELPNSGGASLPGEMNFNIPNGVIHNSDGYLHWWGRNYGTGSGLEIFSNNQSAGVIVDNVQTFQSPWTPLVMLVGPSLTNQIDVNKSVMDSNWNPVIANLGCTTCSYLTMNGVRTTGNVSDFTGNPISNGMDSINTFDPPGWSIGTIQGIGNAQTAFQLAATPTLCTAGNSPTGVDIRGNALNCQAVGGGGGGGPTIQTNSVNNASQTTLNFVNPSAFNGMTFAFSNPTGGQETFTVGGLLGNAGLAHSTFTLNSQLVTLGDTNDNIPFQTNGTNNASLAGLNFINVTNCGLTSSFSNPGTNQVELTVGGTLTAACGGVGTGTLNADTFWLTSSTLGSSLGVVSGQVRTAQNSSPAAWASPGVVDGNGKAPVTTSPYTVQCDSATTILDRGTVIRLQSGASTVNVPLSTGSGCPNTFFVLIDDGAGPVTVQRAAGSTDTFTITDGVTDTTGATSLTMQTGQRVMFTNGISSSSGIWEVDWVNGNGNKLNGTAFSGTNGDAVCFGASNTPADCNVVGANIVTAASAASAANQICVSGGATKTCSYIDMPERYNVPAANCNNATAGAGWSIGSGGTVTCGAGTNNLGGYISISDTSTTFATFQVTVPEDWDTSTNPYVRFYVASTDATNAHTIIPEINVACYKGDLSTTDDVAANGFHSSSTVTLNGNANRFSSQSNVQMNSTDVTGCVAGALMQITVGRATDTATNAEFYGADVTFPRKIQVQAN